MTEFEERCYGMTQEDVRNQYMKSLTARISGLEMVVMGMLSDCQEMLAMKNQSVNSSKSTDEYIRKQLNCAKFILSEMMEEKSKQVA